MEQALSPVSRVNRQPGRWLVWLGLFSCLIGPLLYGILIREKMLLVPWFAPILGTVGVVLLLLALLQARTISRIIVLIVVSLITAFEWFFLFSLSVLPTYAGPAVVGHPFPAFHTQLADGSPFTQDNLKGEQNTAMIFFRGRW